MNGIGINKHNNYKLDKYAPKKTCVRCGSVNHLFTSCESVSMPVIYVPHMPIC